jgi:uncharacterized membrane protein
MRIWYALSFYTLCLIAVGMVVTGRFDMLPAALVLVALYVFIKGKNKTAWAVLALGFTAKLYPIIIAPLFALYLLCHRQYKQLIQGAAIFGAVVLVLNLPWIIIDADGYWQFLSYHMERGLHSESSYASIFLIGKIMGISQVNAGMTYGSWNIMSPAADTLAKSSFYITASFLAPVYALFTLHLLKNPENRGETSVLSNRTAELILRFSLIAIFVMLITSKVFSPQFLIWLCPLIPLVRVRWRYLVWGLFLIVGGLSQYVYPHYYIKFEYATMGYELGEPYLIVMLAIRNFLLLVMAVIYLFPPRSSSLSEAKEKALADNLLPAE